MKRTNIILIVFAFVIVGCLSYTLFNESWGLVRKNAQVEYFEKIKAAEAAFENEDYSKSASLFEEALTFAEAKVGPKEESSLRFWLGNSYYKQAESVFWQYVNVVSDPDIHEIPDLAKAEKLYEKAQFQFEKVAQSESDLTWQANYNKGNALERRLIVMIVSGESSEKIKNFYEFTLKSFFKAKDTYPEIGYDLETIQNIEFLVQSPEEGKSGGLGNILKEQGEVKEGERQIVLPQTGSQASAGARKSGIK